ncbi:MAG: sugar ABC transporter ATP-binding protein [Acidobacteria bacterium]|nr:sugar ABC transporter ATP-binding protein [Acidobacteriota bacterium]MCI0663091.1 sugar ABC transporter ATP-binding protein [Acidobacteriota bacterium]
MNLTPVLEMKGIGKRFPGVVALDGVDLEVRQGEIVGLIGENGAGKSTLMKILGGVTERDTGSIEVAGREVEIHSPREASQLGIEFIHQELSVLDNLDVAANIFLRREPTKGGPLKMLKLIDRKRIYAEADHYLQKIGLDLSSHTPLSKLSLAQQQLVEIARALSAGARILIMDEPSSSLTLTETRRLLEIIGELRTHGVSVIYISHRLEEVREIADRVVVLRDGRNAGLLERHEIEHNTMVRMMVGRDLEDFYIHANGGGNREPNWFGVNRLRTLRYPQHAVSFSVGQGEVLGLAGLVGAGRSEVARALFGVDQTIGAEITLAGRPLNIQSSQDSIAEGIYLVPEDRRLSGLIVEFNIRENITLPGLDRYSTGGLVGKAKELEKANEMCRTINIKTPSTEVRAANLSGGNQQKVVLAKWLALSPRVLIFDEPTRGIDVGAKAEIYGLIRDLAREGVAIIAISSEMEEVLGISDRIAVMHEGRITGILSRDQFSEEAVMRLATGGER